jgi:hypothetical protein
MTSIAVTVAALAWALPAPAAAYVGPGAGLTLLGALWGMLVAIGAAAAFAIAWPVRRMLRRRRERHEPAPAVHEAAPHVREAAREA